MPSDKITARLKKLNTPGRLIHFVSEQLRPDFLSILEEQGELLKEEHGLESQEIVQLAQRKLDEVLEKSQLPLRVSLIGVFTSGKTASLCALLNSPSLLPTAQRPTSGNVVEVNIVPRDEEAQQPPMMKCLLFSVVELEKMIRDYFQWLAAKFDQFQLPAGNILEQEGFLKAKLNTLLTDTQQQLRDAWRERDNGNTKVSFKFIKAQAALYLILLAASRYLEKYPHVPSTDSITLSVPYTPQEPESEERLKAVAMLSMEMAFKELHPEHLEREIVDQFWETIPPTIEELQASCQKGDISTESLRALFPLYKRIILTREMDLSEGWGDIQRVAFLDFPGVGSGNRRDVYLCLQELQLAHVNLLFFLADRPNSEEAHELQDIIATAKQESADLGERIIPIINFFEEYAPLPEKVENNPDETEEAVVQRVDNFFAKQESAGVENGFDVFDEAILGNLRLGPRWNYFLLTPAAAKERDQLSDNEGHAREIYEKNALQYEQLLADLKEAKKFVKGNPEKIQKYRRLELALTDYYRDNNNEGGVTGLREMLIDMLKKKGARLIAEDARQPLREVFDSIADFVAECEELGVVGDDDDPEPDDKVPEEARREVVKLWHQMQAVTEEWPRSGDKASLRYQTADSNEYRSPIEVCEDEVLHQVLSSPFWEDWNITTEPHQTPLQDLVEHYQQMVNELDDWRQTVIKAAITQTLECLEREPLKLKSGEQLSLNDLRDRLKTDYLSKANISPDNKQKLQDLFSFNDLFANELHRQLETRKEQQQALYPDDLLPNNKMPFNENQVFGWSPEEVMKVQYQLSITLQRRTARYFSFYTAVFFEEFRKLISKRLNDIRNQFSTFNKSGEVFDQLAKVSAEPTEDDLSARERAQKADEAVLKILEAWDQLLIAK